MRARLLELEQRLGVRLPVYLLLTKADLLAGFTDFFADLDARGREQVWGATLPWAGGQQRRAVAAQPVREAVGAEVGGLVERLDARAPGRVAAEHDLDRRAAIFGFPAQVAALKADVERFVETVFRETGYERPPLLRGIYLTSGTQTGAPLDRLMAAVTRSFGLPPAAPAQDSGERSFFLTSLLRDVVFAEAGLVGADPALERRQRWLAYGGWAAAAAVLVLVTAGWVVSYLTNSGRALGLERGLAEAGATSGPVARNKLTSADSDLGAVAPALDKLRGLPDGQADSWTGGLGLSLRPAVAQATADAYDHGLEKLLLPRLILRTEQNLRARIGDAAFVREALKVYLMLGDARANDPALLRAWFDADLRRERPDLADRLGPHIAALADLLPQVARRPALDDTLIASAQQTLARLPVEQRAYDDLMGKPEVRALPPWIVSEHAGTAAAQVLVRAGNRPLDQPIPGIFTRAGFHQVFLPGLDEAARGALEEDRKLRPGPAREITGAEVQGVEQRMLDLYYNDAIASWDDLVTSVRLVPLGALTQSVETLKVLAGPASPLKLFYQGVAQETRLTQPPEQQQGALATAEGKLAATAQQQAESSRLGKLLGNLTPTGPVKKPGQPVEDHFAPVRRLAEGQNGAPPPIDDALAGLGELRNKLQEAAAQPNPDEAFAKMGPGAITQLVQSARGLPSPLNDMVGGLAGKAQSLAAGGARRQINDAWRTGVLPFCQSALTGRYPFAGASAVDARLDDVTRLFAPGQMIDGFVTGQLGPYVDMTKEPWRDSQSIGLSRGALSALQRAKRIRDSLFPSGTFKVRFTLTPQGLDADFGLGRARPRRPGAAVQPRRARAHEPQLARPRRHQHRPPHLRVPDQGSGDPDPRGSLVAVPAAAAGLDRQHRPARPVPPHPALPRPPGDLQARRLQRRQRLRPEPAGRLQLPGGVVSGAAGPVGVFGKLPALGDFLLRGLPAGFADPWHGWLADGLATCREMLGDGWLAAYLEAPVWRFALAGDACGPDPVTGVLMPSVDAVGRYFFLTLASPAPTGR